MSDAKHGYTQFVWGKIGYAKARAENMGESDVPPDPDGSGDRIDLVAQETRQVNFVRHLHGDKALAG